MTFSQLVQNSLILIICTATPFISNQAKASSKFAGRWMRTQFSLQVKIEKWGDNCGPRPKSYSNNKKKTVDIVSQGKHLIFSKGGIRTDRCISPNPRLSSISKSIIEGNWRRICQTEKDDSKYERIEYSLTSNGNSNSLSYRSKTKVKWTLKGDHCIAVIKEHRTFNRESKTKETTSPVTPKEAEPELVENSSPECENPGRVRQLSINPTSATIAPMERVCFRAIGVDNNNCHFTTNATWSAYQDEQRIPKLLSQTGCFKAGATAADSEGTYDIIAKVDGKQATAQITVAFPDLNDLLKARLNPVDDINKKASQQNNISAPPLNQHLTEATDVNQHDKETNINIIAIIVGVIMVLGILIIVIVIRRKSFNNLNNDIWDSENTAPKATPKVIICPDCKREFAPDAQFCPFDGATLISKNVSKTDQQKGKVCPKCHRGYENDAQFCPHDSIELITYDKWRGLDK